MAMNPRLLRPTAGFDPRVIPNLALWLDASDASSLFDATTGGSPVAPDGAVARINDKSGANLTAIQTTVNQRPLRKTAVQAGRDVLRFDGSNDCLQVASITLPTYITVFVVSSTTRTGANSKLYMEHSANVGGSAGFYFNGTNASAWLFNRDGGRHSGPSLVDTSDWIGDGWALATLTYDGVGTFYKNNVFVSNATASTSQAGARANSDTTTELNIFSRAQSGLFLAGDLAEILVYKGSLNDISRTAVSNYLRRKWALY